MRPAATRAEGHLPLLWRSTVGTSLSRPGFAVQHAASHRGLGAARVRGHYPSFFRCVTGSCLVRPGFVFRSAVPFRFRIARRASPDADTAESVASARQR